MGRLGDTGAIALSEPYLEALMGAIDPDSLLDSLLARPAWMAAAACVGHPEVDFFPARGAEGPAAAVCDACPVRSDCRAFGRAGRESGVWGGELLAEPRLRQPPASSGRRKVPQEQLDRLAAKAAGWRRNAEARQATWARKAAKASGPNRGPAGPTGPPRGPLGPTGPGRPGRARSR